MNINDITDINEGDKVEIDCTTLRGCPLRVTSLSEESIGLTAVTVVTLSDGDRDYLLQGATHSKTADLVDLDNDNTLNPVTMDDIKLVS